MLTDSRLGQQHARKPAIAVPLGIMSVGDTGFEPVTSSVSVIPGTPDNAAVGVSQVRGCTQMIAGRRTD